MAEGIFISYRREDSRHAAGRILDALAVDHPRSSLFMDVDNIALGFDFRTELDKRLKRCEIMLVVMGSKWLDATDGQGRRRLDQPDDFVRMEVEMALNRNIRVVPIMLDDTDLPAAEDLPESLRPLVHRQGTRIQHESFMKDVERLAEGLAPSAPTVAPPPNNPVHAREAAAGYTPPPGLTPEPAQDPWRDASIFPSKKTNMIFGGVAAASLIIGASSNDIVVMEFFSGIMGITFWAYIGTLGVRYYFKQRANKSA